MRLIPRAAACTVLLLVLATVFGTPAAAQDLLPEQSAVKAKQLLQQVVTALGGQAYLNARDIDCTGRVSQFEANGSPQDPTEFRELWLLPDKNRMEFFSKGEHEFLAFALGSGSPIFTRGGVLVSVFNGSEGWTLDKSGVTNQPEEVIKNFTEQRKAGMNHMLRSRGNEPGLEAHYAGTDLIDLKEAEWIEFNDAEHHILRLAVDRLTHLPLRWVVAKRDPETRVNTEITTSYAEYLPMDGVKTPLNIVVTRNDHRLTQTFLTGCKYNSNLDAQLFTRASLNQRPGGSSKKGDKSAKSKN